MEKKIAEKVLRFVELSMKFSKGEYDLVPKTKEEEGQNWLSNGTGTLLISSVCPSSMQMGFNLNINGRELYIDDSGNVKAKDNKIVTRMDSLKVIAEVKAKLLEEYYEYLKLQFEIRKYFAALKEINE